MPVLSPFFRVTQPFPLWISRAVREACVAKDPMLKFVGEPQAFPAKRAPTLRAEDFREIADRYAVPDAELQAAR